MTHSSHTLKIDVQAEYTFILKWYYNRFIMGPADLTIHCKVPCKVAPNSSKRYTLYPLSLNYRLSLMMTIKVFVLFGITHILKNSNCGKLTQ